MSRIPPLAALTLALVVAACHDVAAPPGARRAARAALLDARRLAVDVEGWEVTRLQLAVHGGTLDGGIELELDGKEGQPLVGALELPPGEGYRVEARGYDAEGRLVQAGKGELSVDEELTPQVELLLEPVEEGGQTWGRVRIGTYRMETATPRLAARKRGERLEVAMAMVDADGVAQPIEPGTVDLEWPFTPYDPPKPEVRFDERKAVIAWEHMGLYGRLKFCIRRRACLSVQLVDPNPPVKVTAGAYVTCVLRAGGSATCWGEAGAGATGQLQGISYLGFGFTDISASGFAERLESHVCGVDGQGAVWCWGYNHDWQLGTQQPPHAVQPVQVSLPRTATQVVAGGRHSCALLDDGSAWCWGSGSLGQLGDGSSRPTYMNDDVQSPPVPVATAERFTQLQAGDFHTCGVTTGGAILCWGGNWSAQAGTKPASSASCFSYETHQAPCEPVPVHASGSITFARVAAGPSDSCGITPGGDAYCWGAAPTGLPHPSQPLSYVLTPVAGGLPWNQLAIGKHARCGIHDGDAATCWGRDLDGLIGDGTGMDAPAPRPGSLATPGPIRAIDAGNTHACAIRGDAKVVCWGYARWSTSGLLGFRLPAGTLHSDIPREVTVPY